MKIVQKKFSKEGGWVTVRDDKFPPEECNMVLVFGSRNLLADPGVYALVRHSYPQAEIVLNTTAGEIIDTQVNEDSISLTAVHFEKTRVVSVAVNIDEVKNSFDAGKSLSGLLPVEELKNVLVISDGQKVNGSELVAGLQSYLPEGTVITGGLAGDGSRFQKTLVGLNESPVEGRIVLVAFYGSDLQMTYGSVGGWDAFGHERLVTRSDKNILYELDGKPALDIYKLYLGDYAAELPGSGLLFPLSIRFNNNSVVRTILGVNEKDKSLTFAGNIQEGAYARLMKANVDRLIEGASNAAQNSVEVKNQNPELAILISCVGRKLVLDQRVEEEVEVTRAIYGEGTAITGFYSYGEISPGLGVSTCELHNQTMTITTLSEN